jgi:phytanoyl-CoA hydroxylase
MTENLDRIDADLSSQWAQGWQTDGYAIRRNLVAVPEIKRLLAEFHEELLPSDAAIARQPSFRREDPTTQYPSAYESTNKLNQHGYLIEGIKNPHVSESQPAFAGHVLSILCNQRVQSALAALNSEFSEYTLHQTMFFDANPKTEPHQDAYYIDSEPRGYLVGAWIALEDIHPDAGPFFVIPGSHRDGPTPADLARKNTDYLNVAEAYRTKSSNRVLAPQMQAGDALFWQAGVVHGSLPTLDPSRSRKSVTAHYIPQALLGRNNFRTFRNTIERVCRGMRYVVTTRPDLESQQLASAQINQVEIAGQAQEFLVVRTTHGEQEVFSWPEDNALKRLLHD